MKASEELKKENEKKKEFLNSYRNLQYKIKSLNSQKESIREAMQQAKSQVIKDMPGGSRQRDLSDYMIKIEWLEDEISRTEKKAKERMIEIEKAILTVEDGREAEILHKRYIEMESWEAICIEIGYSWVQTHKYHGKALRSIALPATLRKE